MTDQIRDIKYALGDVLGRRAPSSFQRPGLGGEWIVGLGSVALAVGISYAALRYYDRMMGQLVDRAFAEKDKASEKATSGKATSSSSSSKKSSGGSKSKSKSSSKPKTTTAKAKSASSTKKRTASKPKKTPVSTNGQTMGAAHK